MCFITISVEHRFFFSSSSFKFLFVICLYFVHFKYNHIFSINIIAILFGFRLDRLVDPLRTTVTSKVKANSVKQEYEKQDELKRSAMRSISALLTIPDADKNPQLSDFVNHIKSTNELKELYESVQKDSGIYSESTYMDLE